MAEPGLVAAMYAGMRAATGDVLALTDDDAVPRSGLGGADRRRTSPIRRWGCWAAGTRWAGPGMILARGDHDRRRRADRPVGQGRRQPPPGHGRCAGRRRGEGRQSRGAARRRGDAARPARIRGAAAQRSRAVRLGKGTRLAGRVRPRARRGSLSGGSVRRGIGVRRGGRPMCPPRRTTSSRRCCANAAGLAWRRARYGLPSETGRCPGGCGPRTPSYAAIRARTRTRAVAGRPGAALRDHTRGRRPAMTPVEPVERRPDRSGSRLSPTTCTTTAGWSARSAELVRRAGRRVAFTVVAARLDPELRRRVVGWNRVPVPRPAFPLRFAAFYLLAGAGCAGAAASSCIPAAPSCRTGWTWRPCICAMRASSRRPAGSRRARVHCRAGSTRH